MNNLFTIDCGDILLREFRIEDADAIYELTSQPEVYNFLPDWRSTKEQRTNWVTNYEIPDNKKFLLAVPNISGANYLKLGIILKETGEFIGFCNTGIKEELSEPNREVVYAISKQYSCRGYTTTAVKGLIKYLFENTDVELLNTVVLPHNLGSNKVIQKCGFRFNGEIEIEDQIHYHYTLNKEDWKGKKSLRLLKYSTSGSVSTIM
ncbi:GNAT family N-acetyltransferase [Lysinibacillus tabacifolii]|uniref:GNAT family N-acetyltransferase n=1 Tax=Lysinibacillus tabacifolii TaxID=1173107 RepID=A0ABY2SY81_9BACI|nr:GNAT family N-acetyltransferase [Lysinibacillus tabacifolii]TKI48251.1 GNAT family N-acetyltransferase [Lysinibacillus tabacifolii]